MIAGIEVLPTGFALPPLPYLIGLVMGTAIVGSLLVMMQPPFRSWDVLAAATWMAFGATLHALHQIGAFPDLLSPLMAAPAVYLTTFIVAGFVWLIATVGTAGEIFQSIPRLTGVVGLNFTLVFMAFFLWFGSQSGGYTISPIWPVIALVAAIAVAGLAFIALSFTYTTAAAVTGKAGLFVVFAHALDGISTAIGIDVIGVSERSPVPRTIMEIAAGLPTADVIGVGWLFVVVKLVLALAVVALFAEYVREEESHGNLLLAFIAAVGFGPGVYNLLLFSVSATPV